MTDLMTGQKHLILGQLKKGNQQTSDYFYFKMLDLVGVGIIFSTLM